MRYNTYYIYYKLGFCAFDTFRILHFLFRHRTTPSSLHTAGSLTEAKLLCIRIFRQPMQESAVCGRLPPIIFVKYDEKGTSKCACLGSSGIASKQKTQKLHAAKPLRSFIKSKSGLPAFCGVTR